MITIIEGRCASGKTTLASQIAQNTGGQIIHMDDFFLPIELRTKERLDEPGGNIHYERFIEEVVGPIKAGKSFTYRIFNCKAMDYIGEKTIDINQPIIIEGAYSMHPKFCWQNVHSIFLDIDPKTQLERIEKRNGPIVKEIFREKWIPLENKYFEHYDIPNACTLFRAFGSD